MSGGTPINPSDLFGATRYQFGDRRVFGIECEVQDCELDPWGAPEPYGSFWMWVGGKVVGHADAEEQLVHAFRPLRAAVGYDGCRSAGLFRKELSNLDRLKQILWVNYGEDEEFDGERWGFESAAKLRALDVRAYEVIDIGGSPYTDGWQAILVEDESADEFIWRRWFGEASEVGEFSLPKGLFTAVAAEACAWFEPMWSQRMASVLVKVEPGEIARLVKRVDSD